jgi:hypothetical protein
MDMTVLMMVAASGFLCGVALMYLVMMRTMKKRAAEGQMTNNTHCENAESPANLAGLSVF